MRAGAVYLATDSYSSDSARSFQLPCWAWTTPTRQQPRMAAIARGRDNPRDRDTRNLTGRDPPATGYFFAAAFALAAAGLAGFGLAGAGAPFQPITPSFSTSKVTMKGLAA